MLETFRFLVHLIPGILEDIVQKKFEQPVMAYDFPAATFAGRGEPHAAMLFVQHQRRLLRSELLKHPGDRSRTHRQPLGQGVARNALLARAAQFENRFEVIVDRFGNRRSGELGWH